jgi:hypothetical protein
MLTTGTSKKGYRSAAPRLRDVVAQTLRGLARDLFDPYRPELHYMRGPGPKWRAKHAAAIVRYDESRIVGELRAA